MQTSMELLTRCMREAAMLVIVSVLDLLEKQPSSIETTVVIMDAIRFH